MGKGLTPWRKVKVCVKKKPLGTESYIKSQVLMPVYVYQVSSVSL